jgi:hypothetical protein
MLLTTPWPYNVFSECNGLALTEDNKVAAVGIYYSAWTGDY